MSSYVLYVQVRFAACADPQEPQDVSHEIANYLLKETREARGTVEASTHRRSTGQDLASGVARLLGTHYPLTLCRSVY